jgi:dimeric dUTPase (all-alpha-NTP-PPase superfamily)
MELIKQVEKSFELQDKLNSIVNPDWKYANYPWYRAAWIEAAELMDHAGYKWWKNVDQEIDREQVLLELVDIYHFLVSDMIITKNPPMSVVNTYNRCKSLKIKDKEDILREVETFVSVCLETESVLPLDFCRLVVSFGFTIENILKWYIAKNTLNIFRQDNGYKTGEYIKNWSGVEDNVVLAGYVTPRESVEYDELYEFLSNSYQKVKNNEAV